MTSAVGATRVVIGEVDENEVCDFVRNNRHVFDLITRYTEQRIAKEHIRETIRVATAVLVALTKCSIPRHASEIRVSKKVSDS